MKERKWITTKRTKKSVTPANPNPASKCVSVCWVPNSHPFENQESKENSRR